MNNIKIIQVILKKILLVVIIFFKFCNIFWTNLLILQHLRTRLRFQEIWEIVK